MGDRFAPGKKEAEQRGERPRGEDELEQEDARGGEHPEHPEHPESKRYGPLAEAIGERIRAVRVAQRRSRAHLARAANLADSHLGEIERGEITPGSGTLAKLAVALWVEVGAIFPDLALLAPLAGLESGPEREGKAQYASYLANGSGTNSGSDSDSGEHYGYDSGGETLAGLLEDRGSRIPDIEGEEVGNENRGRGRGGKDIASRDVEMLLSPAVVARMAHVEARTLQKWIAQGLVTPSFYVMQEQRSPKQGATGSRGQEASRSAAFRREDLPGIIEVRNRARVRQRQRGHTEQFPPESSGE